MAVDIADVVVTAFLGVAGLLLGLSWYRDHQLKIAEERLSAYRNLWKLMEAASPTRTEAGGEGPLTRKEAKELDRRLGSWYYNDGHGLLLTLRTSDLYLEARKRLRSYSLEQPKAITPPRAFRDGNRPWEQRQDEPTEAFDALRAYIALSPIKRAQARCEPRWREWACEWAWDDRTSEWDEGRRRIRELSLLRTQMKLDVQVIGHSYWRQQRTLHDRDFLGQANIDIDRWARKRWYRRLFERQQVGTEGRGMNAISELRRLNDQTFRAEAKHEIEGLSWEAFLRSVLADDFALRRSSTDAQDETREQMLARIRDTDRPVERTVLEKSVQVWASDALAAVKCVVTIPAETGGAQLFQNIKVFRANPPGNWLCVYWQVTARPDMSEGVGGLDA